MPGMRTLTLMTGIAFLAACGGGGGGGTVNPPPPPPPTNVSVSDIQGSGSASPLQGQTVTVRGQVTGDFQDLGLQAHAVADYRTVAAAQRCPNPATRLQLRPHGIRDEVVESLVQPGHVGQDLRNGAGGTVGHVRTGVDDLKSALGA